MASMMARTARPIVPAWPMSCVGLEPVVQKSMESPLNQRQGVSPKFTLTALRTSGSSTCNSSVALKPKKPAIRLRKLLTVSVILYHRIVIGLSGKAHFVFRTGQLFHELRHRLVAFRSGSFQQLRKALPMPDLRRSRLCQGIWWPPHRRGLERLFGKLIRLAVGFHHAFKRFALMFEKRLGGFHQIGNQVMASLQLNVNLSERVLKRFFRLTNWLYMAML